MLKYITKNTSHTRYVSYGGEGGIPPPPAFETASGSRSSLRRSRPHSKYAPGIFLGVGFESHILRPNQTKTEHRIGALFFMADAKGFEPSIFSVTGRRVNRATPRVQTSSNHLTFFCYGGTIAIALRAIW